jgi:hypothetical protein
MAESRPRGTAMMVAISSARTVSSSVIGNLAARSLETASSKNMDTPKSSLSMPHTQAPYCTYSGLSVPSLARIASSCAWVNFASPVSPTSFTSAGSPGMRRRRINTIRVAISRVGINSKNLFAI